MAPNVETASLILSLAIAFAAVSLAMRQWSEWRNREPHLSPADRIHFSRQDWRRVIGIVVLLLLAYGVRIGSLLEPMVAGGANPHFLMAWLVVFELIFLALGLALWDWLATRKYAARHKQSMARSRVEIFRKPARIPGSDPDFDPPGGEQDFTR
jgi:hypothetical protein